MPAGDAVTVTFSRNEALALARIAAWGLRAAEAFSLIPNTSTAERALATLNAATAPKRASR